MVDVNNGVVRVLFGFQGSFEGTASAAPIRGTRINKEECNGMEKAHHCAPLCAACGRVVEA